MTDWNRILKEMNIHDDGIKYITCMRIIVNRMNLVKSYLEDKSNLEKDKLYLTIEFISLQYRKVFELIILASLAANRKAVTTQYLHLLSEYNPERIIKAMKKINPNYYPQPIKVETIFGIQATRILPMTDKHLSESELKSAWRLCSDYLHARNPYGKPIGTKQILKNFQVWWDKIQALLFTHCIKLKQEYIFLITDVPFYDVEQVKATFVAIGPDLK
jgi:hypothetical protein